MADKKPKSPEPEESPLEKQVDAYMDPELPDPATPEKLDSQASGQPAGPPALPPIDIFSDAPQEVKSTADTDKHDDTSTEPAPEKKSEEVSPAAVDADSEHEKPQAQQIEPSTTVADDPTVAADPLVDDIVAHEGDELLAAQDARFPRTLPSDKPSFGKRLSGFFGAWWGNKLVRYSTILIIFIALLAAGMIPNSRYYILNNAGVRSAASVSVMDRTTQLPLRNVKVQIGEVAAKTDKEGVAKLSEVKLGTQQMTISQLGFAEVRQTVTLGLGSNPLGDVQLKAVGVQVKILLSDYLSGKPVKEAEAVSGESTAQSDDKGEIVLTLGTVSTEKLPVTVTAKGYRTEKLTLDVTNKQATKVVMVTDRKHVFVSKQSGKYDVYQMSLDGKGKKVLLAGTGLENSQITIVQHPAESKVAVVSSRDNKRNQDGFMLQTLTLVDTGMNEKLTLDTSEQIHIVDWIRNKLVYVKIKAGTSAGNPERYQLMSYDYDTTAHMQLATANYFSDIVSAKGNIYFAAANNFQGGQSQFVRIGPDNTGKQVLLNSEIWDIGRSRYDKLTLHGPSGWYEYNLGASAPKKLSAVPANSGDAKFYLDADDNRHALWTENRDGKGVLISYNSDTKKDTVLAAQSGLTYPLKWLNNKIAVYRVVTPAETADYAVHIDGGQPKKLTDVTNSLGFGPWLYR